MDKFRINGGRPLAGRVSVSGAKNSALPCMAAALLTSEPVILHNVPYVRDISYEKVLSGRSLQSSIGCADGYFACVLTDSARRYQ